MEHGHKTTQTDGFRYIHMFIVTCCHTYIHDSGFFLGWPFPAGWEKKKKIVNISLTSLLYLMHTHKQPSPHCGIERRTIQILGVVFFRSFFPVLFFFSSGWEGPGGRERHEFFFFFLFNARKPIANGG